MLRVVAILDISYSPGIITHQLEGRAALTFFATLETYIIVFYRFAPTMIQILACSGINTRLSSLFLDKHVVETIALEIVDISIDGSISPVEEQLWSGNLGESLISIAVVHAVVLFLCTVEHRIVNHVSTLLTIFPAIIRIPKDLRCPDTVDSTPVLIRRLSSGSIAEVPHTLAIIEGNAGPMNQVLTLQEVDAIVVPFVALTNTHISSNHNIAFAVMGTGDVSIAGTAFDTGMLLWVEDRFTLVDILIVVAITRNSIGCPFTLITHVTVEIAIISLYKILCGHWHEGSQRQENG